MAKWKKDVMFGVILLVVSVLMLLDLRGMNEVVIQYPAALAARYSGVWLGALMILSVALIVRALKERDTTPTKSALTSTSLISVGILSAYLLLIKPLGYLFSTILFLISLMTFYSYKSENFKDENGNWKPMRFFVKEMLVIIIASVAVALITYLLFRKGVGVMLPEFSLW